MRSSEAAGTDLGLPGTSTDVFSNLALAREDSVYLWFGMCAGAALDSLSTSAVTLGAIPEPSAVALVLGAAVATWALCRRRRRAQAGRRGESP